LLIIDNTLKVQPLATGVQHLFDAAKGYEAAGKTHAKMFFSPEPSKFPAAAPPGLGLFAPGTYGHKSSGDNVVDYERSGGLGSIGGQNSRTDSSMWKSSPCNNVKETIGSLWNQGPVGIGNMGVFGPVTNSPVGANTSSFMNEVHDDELGSIEEVCGIKDLLDDCKMSLPFDEKTVFVSKLAEVQNLSLWG
jgi:hypothetical protein